MKKVQAAVDMGAEAIMDLSSFGDTQKFRRKLTSECPAVLVPCRFMMPLFTITKH